MVLLIAEGLSNDDISKKLGCSLETVKRHLNVIFDKIGCDNRVELVVMTVLRDAEQKLKQAEWEREKYERAYRECTKNR